MCRHSREHEVTNFVCLFLVKPYERMNLKELKEAEDDFDEADRKAVEMYRYSKLFLAKITEVSLLYILKHKLRIF